MHKVTFQPKRLVQNMPWLVIARKNYAVSGTDWVPTFDCPFPHAADPLREARRLEKEGRLLMAQRKCGSIYEVVVKLPKQSSPLSVVI